LSDEARVRFMLEINDSRRDQAWQKAHPDKVQKAIDYTLAARKDLPRDAQSRLGAQRQLAARADHDVLALLSQIQHTTLICAGRYDDIAPKNNQTLMADAMPQAELAWFEGGHLFMIQDKTAWPTIIEFLTRPSD
jgi:3-oxoadipate enol-lactonase